MLLFLFAHTHAHTHTHTHTNARVLCNHLCFLLLFCWFRLRWMTRAVSQAPSSRPLVAGLPLLPAPWPQSCCRAKRFVRDQWWGVGSFCFSVVASCHAYMASCHRMGHVFLTSLGPLPFIRSETHRHTWTQTHGSCRLLTPCDPNCYLIDNAAGRGHFHQEH